MASRSSLRWGLVTLFSLFMVLTSALVLSNGVSESSVFLSLRVSSLTTALPFLLVFSIRPLQRLRWTSETGQWAQAHYRELWVVAAVSHLIHLAQIGLYYSLGQSCPALTWVVTVPLWVIVEGFAGMAIFAPDWFVIAHSRKPLLYEFGCWYTWLIFTLAFSLGAAAQHLLFYNLPAAILFVAVAVLRSRPQRLISAQ